MKLLQENDKVKKSYIDTMTLAGNETKRKYVEYKIYNCTQNVWNAEEGHEVLSNSEEVLKIQLSTTLTLANILKIYKVSFLFLYLA